MHLIAVEENPGSIVLAEKQLAMLRPEVVLFVELDCRQWSETASRICQPRACAELTEKTVESLENFNILNLIHAHRIIHKEYQDNPDQKRENLFLWQADDANPLSTLTRATFGFMPLRSADKYGFLNAAARKLTGTHIADYLAACVETKESWSWLDFASNNLETHGWPEFAISPTIVVYSPESAADWAQYWNLRMSVGVGYSGRIVLFPASGIGDEVSLNALAAWVTKCAVDANYVQIVSRSCRCNRLRTLAIALRRRLSDTQFKFVELPRAPLIENTLACEDQRQLTGRRHGSQIIFEAPRPICVEALSGSDVWICDLMKDADRDRAPGELLLPPTITSFEILNAPFPPSISNSRDIGQGVDSINMCCRKRDHLLKLVVPTETELIEGMLIDKGFMIEKDEKRIRYQQALSLFGSIERAARVVSGSFGKAVNALSGTRENGTRPMSLRDVCDAVGSVVELSMAERLKWVEEFTKGRGQEVRIGKERFRRYYEEEGGICCSVKDIMDTLW